MTIARLYDFQPGQTIQSDQIDAEFNQLVAAVNAAAVKDGSLQEDLNADLLDGFEASESGGTDTIPVCNGDLQVALNAEMLGGMTAADFAEAGFPAGTALLFYQADPPPGWTAVARPGYDRVLAWGASAAGGGMNRSNDYGGSHSSGSHSWTTLTAGFDVVVDDHVLSVGELPSHTHSVPVSDTPGGSAGLAITPDGSVIAAGLVSGAAGSGQGHDHDAELSMAVPSWRPPSAWIIIATKDA